MFLCRVCLQFCEKMRCIAITRSFICIGGGVVPPPMSCRTLGRAMRRKARRLALAEASMDVSVPCVLAILLKNCDALV